MGIRVDVSAEPGRAAAGGAGAAGEGAWPVDDAARELLARAAEAALRDHGVDAAHVSLTLLGDEAMADLNARYLGHEGPTDVLAFALHEGGEAPVGDVYVGWEQARRQAAELDVPLPEELVRLAVHGTLHVLGHDHSDDEDRVRGPMWERQERIVAEVMGR